MQLPWGQRPLKKKKFLKTMFPGSIWPETPYLNLAFLWIILGFWVAKKIFGSKKIFRSQKSTKPLSKIEKYENQMRLFSGRFEPSKYVFWTIYFFALFWNFFSNMLRPLDLKFGDHTCEVMRSSNLCSECPYDHFLRI